MKRDMLQGIRSLLETQKQHWKHIKYIKCWYKLAVAKESGWGHCWKVLWKEKVQRRRGEVIWGEILWKIEVDLAPVPLSGVDFIPDIGERWLPIWSGCQGEEGKGEAGWTGEKGRMAGLVGDFWRHQKKREGGRGRGENMHTWNYKLTDLALELVKKHCLLVMLRWFSGVLSQLIFNFQYLLKFGKL